MFSTLDENGRATFGSGEHLWLDYRRASCRAAASPFSGGSIGPVVFLRCEERLDGTHLADLAADLRALRKP